jgi:hypothetical protein
MNKAQLQGLIKEVMEDMSKQALKAKLKKLVVESMEEIKYEKEDTVVEDMEAIEKIAKEYNKDATVKLGDDKNYWINETVPHKFHIRPQSEGVYDVQYFKDDTDRTKKLNLKFEELKKFIKDTLSNKDLNYVKTAYNKTAGNSEDQIEKGEIPTHHKFVKKEVKDTKNDNKDYTEPMVKNEKDLQDKPMYAVEKFEKQSDHSIKGTKPDYTYPKQKDKKLLIKLKAYRNKTRKKD